MTYLAASTPVPPRGFYNLNIHIVDDERIDIKPPNPNELPMCEVSFIPLAKYLSPENIVWIVNNIVLERNVLLVTSHPEILTPIIAALLTLIFPFEYQLINIPVLPLHLFDFLQTSVPFIVGIHSSHLSRAEQLIASYTCVVNIDQDNVNALFEYMI